MIRTIFRDDRILFGPLRDTDLAVISKEPVFSGHGVSVIAGNGHVDVFATLPADTTLVTQLNKWFLQNHKILV